MASAHLAYEMSKNVDYDEDVEATAQSVLYAERQSRFEPGSLEEYLRCRLSWEQDMRKTHNTDFNKTMTFEQEKHLIHSW